MFLDALFPRLHLFPVIPPRRYDTRPQPVAPSRAVSPARVSEDDPPPLPREHEAEGRVRRAPNAAVARGCLTLGRIGAIRRALERH